MEQTSSGFDCRDVEQALKRVKEISFLEIILIYLHLHGGCEDCARKVLEQRANFSGQVNDFNWLQSLVQRE